MSSMITYLMNHDLRISALNAARAIDGPAASNAATRLYDVRHDAIDAFASIQHLTRFADSVRTTGYEHFLALLHSTRLRGCTQAVDRIYGILGLTTPALVDLLEKKGLITYGSNYVDIFLGIAKEFIMYDPPLLTLALAASSTRPPGLPTWCPNWASPAPSANFGSVHIYHAGRPGTGIYQSERVTSNHCDQILVKGRRIDVVKETVKSFYAWDQDPSRWRGEQGCATQLRAWSTACLRLAQDTYADDEFENAYWRTMIGDKTTDEALPTEQASPLWLAGCKLWRKALETYEQGGTPDWQEGQQYVVTEYHRYVENACKGRTFFNTAGGRIGLGPPDTKPGDLVCLLYPAHPVFILRQTDREIIPKAKEEYLHLMQQRKWSFEQSELDGLKAVELVGDAYVHGLMYGEGLNMAGKEDERFLIA